LDETQKWWWSIFIWALGVATTNGYKIYVVMWQEEKDKGRVDFPPMWSHAEFLEQLVYDMIFPTYTILHQNSLQDNDNSSQLLSSFGGSDLYDREWDFSCQSGIDDFLENKNVTKIMVGNINGNVFAHHFDG
jgi:hypothetical protein